MTPVLQGVTSFIVNKDLIFKPGTESLGVAARQHRTSQDV